MPGFLSMERPRRAAAEKLFFQPQQNAPAAPSVMEILRDFTLDDILSGVAFLICVLAIPVVLAVL